MSPIGTVWGANPSVAVAVDPSGHLRSTRGTVRDGFLWTTISSCHCSRLSSASGLGYLKLSAGSMLAWSGLTVVLPVSGAP